MPYYTVADDKFTLWTRWLGLWGTAALPPLQLSLLHVGIAVRRRSRIRTSGIVGWSSWSLLKGSVHPGANAAGKTRLRRLVGRPDCTDLTECGMWLSGGPCGCHWHSVQPEARIVRNLARGPGDGLRILVLFLSGAEYGGVALWASIHRLT